MGIVGRNGAGKTTPAANPVRHHSPTKGDFTVRGRIAPIFALGSGFDGLLTGRENARIGAAILGLSRSRSTPHRRIKEFADIGSFFEQPMRTYSRA